MWRQYNGEKTNLMMFAFHNRILIVYAYMDQILKGWYQQFIPFCGTFDQAVRMLQRVQFTVAGPNQISLQTWMALHAAVD